MRYLPHYRGPRPTDIPESLGFKAPYWCERCGFTNTEPQAMTTRATHDDPEDSELRCGDCGRPVYETDTHRPIKATRRRTIHTHLEVAA